VERAGAEAEVGVVEEEEEEEEEEEHNELARITLHHTLPAVRPPAIHTTPYLQCAPLLYILHLTCCATPCPICIEGYGASSCAVEDM
jgi:hypothetical protein